MSGRLFLIVAGDPSGDLHAANLIAALKRNEPSARVAVVGGPLCRAVADEFIEDLASRGVTGFLEPALKIPFLLRLRARLRDFLRDERPAALICVDFYGFNRRVLSLAKEAGVPAFYFVSPQVWAWRRGRVRPGAAAFPAAQRRCQLPAHAAAASSRRCRAAAGRSCQATWC